MSAHRDAVIAGVNEAMQAGARQSAACEIIGISAKTLQRWEQPENTQDGRLDALHEPSTKFTQWERERIIEVANKPDYAALSPSKIVPKLADEGRYIGSESSFYRVLKASHQLSHRHKAKPTRTVIKPEALTARRPNQIYSWDITYLPTEVRGIFLYLYLVMDIYSREVVGWQVYEEESSVLAADLMTDICHREGVKRQCVTLHSDNGSPMKGATLLATLHTLGVIPSFSRPSVSNDNPYSESLFRTLKYRPEYPEGMFSNLHSARRWVRWFVDWYNNDHLHSSIQFLTPAQRHARRDADILARREQVYRDAKAQHPQRWSGNIRNWQPVGACISIQKKTDQKSTKIWRRNFNLQATTPLKSADYLHEIVFGCIRIIKYARNCRFEPSQYTRSWRLYCDRQRKYSAWLGTRRVCAGWDDRGDRLEILCGPDYRDRYDLCQFEGNTETHLFSEMPDDPALPIVDMKKEIVALDIEAVLSDKMD